MQALRSRRQGWLFRPFVVVLASFAAGLGAAQADIRQEGRLTRVTGKLVQVVAGGVQVDAGDGNVVTIAIGPQTTHELVAKGTEEFLVPGAPVIVRGRLVENDKIGEATIKIMLRNIPAGIEILPATQDKPHIAVAALIGQSSPLQIVGTDVIRNRYIVNSTTPGSPVVSWAGRTFDVELQQPARGRRVIDIDVGSALNLIKAGSYVSLTYPTQGAAVATHLYVRQDEPMDIELFRENIPRKGPAGKKK